VGLADTPYASPSWAGNKTGRPRRANSSSSQLLPSGCGSDVANGSTHATLEALDSSASVAGGRIWIFWRASGQTNEKHVPTLSRTVSRSRIGKNVQHICAVRNCAAGTSPQSSVTEKWRLVPDICPAGFESDSAGIKRQQGAAKRRPSDVDWEIGSRSWPVFRPMSIVPEIRRVNSSCVDQLAPFKRGKCLDGFSHLFLGEPQFVEAL
jgi:hypothetical protein